MRCLKVLIHSTPMETLPNPSVSQFDWCFFNFPWIVFIWTHIGATLQPHVTDTIRFKPEYHISFLRWWWRALSNILCWVWLRSGDSEQFISFSPTCNHSGAIFVLHGSVYICYVSPPIYSCSFLLCYPTHYGCLSTFWPLQPASAYYSKHQVVSQLCFSSVINKGAPLPLY